MHLPGAAVRTQCDDSCKVLSLAPALERTQWTLVICIHTSVSRKETEAQRS